MSKPRLKPKVHKGRMIDCPQCNPNAKKEKGRRKHVNISATNVAPAGKACLLGQPQLGG